MYKCYILDFNTKKYYIYIKEDSIQILGSDNLEKPVVSAEKLEPLANIKLTGITENTIHLVYDKKTNIYGTRNTNFDIKV